MMSILHIPKKRKKKHISNIHTFAYQLDVSALDWRWRRRRLQSIYFLYMRTKRSVHARTFNAHRQYILSVLCVVVVVKKAHTNTHTHEYKLTNEQWTIVCIKTFNEFIFIKGKFNAFALCVHTHTLTLAHKYVECSQHHRICRAWTRFVFCVFILQTCAAVTQFERLFAPMGIP